MATAKIVTWSRPNHDGTFPIGIKISKNGKPSYLFDGYTVPTRDHWDATNNRVRKTAPNAAKITRYLLKKLSEVTEMAIDLETNKRSVTAEAIKETVKPTKKVETEALVVTFKNVADQYLNEQKALGNRDIYITDTCRLKRFYAFIKDKEITFQEITVDLLRRYTVYLRASQNSNVKESKPLSERTITNHLLILRTLYNRAVTAKLIVKDENYPFSNKGKISIKFGKSKKVGLNETEIRFVSELDLTGALSHFNNARNIWLFSYCFAGMRITDALLVKWSDFQNDRFHYTMSKNGEPGSLKVPEKAKAILEQYKDSENKSHDLVFPFLKHLKNLDDRNELRKQVANVTNLINKHMNKIMKMLEITKSASTHKARHSFAQRAEEHKISPKVLQAMYRHEDIKTTMIYQSNFSHDDADAAIDAVVSF